MLVWQVNARASHINRFQQYLSTASSSIVGFDDIILAASLKRLSAGVVKKLEVKIAAPKNPALVPSSDWSAQALRMMSGVGATSISIDVSTRMKSGLAAEIKKCHSPVEGLI